MRSSNFTSSIPTSTTSLVFTNTFFTTPFTGDVTTDGFLAITSTGATADMLIGINIASAIADNMSHLSQPEKILSMNDMIDPLDKNESNAWLNVSAMCCSSSFSVFETLADRTMTKEPKSPFVLEINGTTINSFGKFSGKSKFEPSSLKSLIETSEKTPVSTFFLFINLSTKVTVGAVLSTTEISEIV